MKRSKTSGHVFIIHNVNLRSHTHIFIFQKINEEMGAVQFSATLLDEPRHEKTCLRDLRPV